MQQRRLLVAFLALAMRVVSTMESISHYFKHAMLLLLWSTLNLSGLKKHPGTGAVVLSSQESESHLSALNIKSRPLCSIDNAHFRRQIARVMRKEAINSHKPFLRCFQTHPKWMVNGSEIEIRTAGPTQKIWRNPLQSRVASRPPSKTHPFRVRISPDLVA